jgi:ribosomal protein L22
MVEEKKTKQTEAQQSHPLGKEKMEDKKTETKEEKKKVEVKKVAAKDVAIVNGFSQRISTKYSFKICKMIKGKTIENAVADLELVVLKKKAVPMHNLEVPHRKGNMAGGRFPVTAAKVFIELLNQLKANAVVNQVENPVITVAMANQASRPFRRSGQQGKRTHIHLEAKDKTKLTSRKK